MKNFHCNNGFFSQHQWFLLGLTLLTPVVMGLAFFFEFKACHQCRFICLLDNFSLFRPYEQVFSPGFGAVTMFFFPALHREASRWPRLSVSVVKVGSEDGEFFSFCILLLPLLAAVLPALQTGNWAEQWDNQMQTLHEGASDILFFTDKMNVVLILSKMHLFVCKSVLPLFRCLTSIERSVEQCQISVSSTLTDRVMIQFFCRHGNVSRCWRCIKNPHHLVAAFPNYPIFVCFCDRHH